MKAIILLFVISFSSTLFALENQWKHVSLKTYNGLNISIDFRTRNFQTIGSHWIDILSEGDVWINLYEPSSFKNYKNISVLFLDGNGHKSLTTLRWSARESKFTAPLVSKDSPVRLNSHYSANTIDPDQKFCQSLVVIADSEILEPTFRFCMSDY